MIKLNELLKILIGMVAAILVGVWIGLNYDKKVVLTSPPMIPPRPDTLKVMYYDFDEEQWKYLMRGRRANEENCIQEPYLKEEDLQRYLEKKVRNYQKDTYWGEEYDLENLDENRE